MENDAQKDIDLYDVADWLWAYRLLGLALAIVSIAVAVVLWTTGSRAPVNYRAQITVYASGTPVRSPEEIYDILVEQLVAQEFEVNPGAVRTAASAPSALVADFPSQADANQAMATIAGLEVQLTEEVEERRAATQPLIDNNGEALVLNLAADAFIKGQSEGLIKLIRAEVTEESTSRSLRNSVATLVGAAFLFFLLAGSHTFWTHWQLRRARSN